MSLRRSSLALSLATMGLAAIVTRMFTAATGQDLYGVWESVD